MATVYLFYLILLSHLVLLLSARYGNGYQDNCPRSFNCGKLGTFHYPFTKAGYEDCGLLVIHNCDKDDDVLKIIQLEKNGKKVILTGFVQQDKIISISDDDFLKRLQNKTCDTLNHNFTLPSPSPLVSTYIRYNVTLFRCNHKPNVIPPPQYYKYPCPDYDIYYDSGHVFGNKDEARTTFSACSVLKFPTKDSTDTKDILSFVSSQAVLVVQLSDECDQCFNHKKGQCRLDTNNNFICNKAKAEKIGKKVLIMTIASFIGVAMMLLLACCFRRQLFILAFHYFQHRNSSTSEMIIERFLEQHGHLHIRRYNYSEIKKVTNCFETKLGEGGYGSVYKGKLQDGCLVAIKVLSELKGTGEEFINEVASISRTSHVNIVSLLGFCFQGSKRALIYEFMPNGSLEKFIYEENSLTIGRQLDCKTLFDIAIGVGRGLDYLHRGCNTRILHFDIKPHNILLDEDLCPKISDFGLAKICTRKESIVSILGARGTIGYIAPEVFSRNFGGVSHKSDVYSYGMLVLEMVGGRNNINLDVECSSEIYFPHWIYKRLELNQDFGLRCLKSETDREKVKKMIVVSLWCIQTKPSTRPSMSKVVEMLEGSLESLEVPPEPFLHSRSPSAHCSVQTSETL